MARPIRQNATHKVMIGPFLDVTDGFTPELSLTLAGFDEAEALRHDGTTVVSISGYTWAAITTMDGHYNLTLQTGITDTVGHMRVVFQDDSVFLPVWEDFIVIEEAVYDALYAASAGGFLRTGTGTEPSQGAPPLAPTMEEAIMYLYIEWVRNKVTVDTILNFKTVFADNTTTALYKKSLADVSSVFTEGEAVTGA